ncbi:MAG: YybH family protein [Pseudomonadota bacterium]
MIHRLPYGSGKVVCMLSIMAVLLFAGGLSTAAAPDDMSNQAQEERKAINQLMEQFYKGFSEKDADMLDGLYADDADWTNAFGHEETGNDAIIEYLRGLFADSSFAAGEIDSAPDITVLPINEGAVMVKTFVKIKGQETANGKVLPVRHNYSMKVLARQPDGSWLIKADMYMDARSDVTYQQK